MFLVLNDTLDQQNNINNNKFGILMVFQLPQSNVIVDFRFIHNL